MVADSSHAVGVRNNEQSDLANDVVICKSGQFKNVVKDVNIVNDVVIGNNDKRIVVFKNKIKKLKKYHVVPSPVLSNNVYDYTNMILIHLH